MNISHTIFTRHFPRLILFTVLCNSVSCGKLGVTQPPASQSPVADFTFTGGNCNYPCQVVFTNTSTHATSYSWNFGDGSTSTETNPSKSFNSSGTYNVTLTATSSAGSNARTRQVTIQPQRGTVNLAVPPMNIYLPNNCARSFTISNTGPAGSSFDFAVNDNGALGGFLSLTNATGTLTSGNSATVIVSVNPLFVNATPSLIGSTLVLDVFTPNATNATHSYVSVYIKGIAEQALELIGNWTGTWSGNSFGVANPGQPFPTSPVSGTWTMNVQAIDFLTYKITGTLNWAGTDAYWAYTFDGSGNILTAQAQPFNANRTIPLNSSNASLQFPIPGSGCNRFRVIINDFPSSTYGVYGPKLYLDLDLLTKIVVVSASSYTAWPYAPVFTSNLSSNQSNGGVSGFKL